MRPISIHLLILSILALFGLFISLGEMAGPEPQGIFSRYMFTTVYWYVFAWYVLGSTIIVSMAAVVQRFRTKRLSRVAVVLSHVVPAGLIWAFISLGVHDYVGDVLKKHDLERRQARPKPAAPGGPPPSPASSIKKPSIHSSSGPIEPVEQGRGE